MVTVAVVDDGINSLFYGINKIKYSIEITSDLMIRELNESNFNTITHGTICAAILKKYYPEVTLISIKILDEKSHKCKREKFIKAIEWCIFNNVKVINLSLGTIDFRDFESIKKIVDKANNAGIIIVAAYSNKDIFTYPASYTNVIGVKCCKVGKLEEEQYIFDLYPIDGIEVTSCSEHKLLKNRVTNKCNSYATPMITAEVCKIIDKHSNITLDEIKRELYTHSINYKYNIFEINNFKYIDWIGNAALLIANKKEYNLELSYLNNIKFFKQSDNINVDQFDTLILLGNKENDYKEEKSIIQQFQKKQKNIVIITNEYKNYQTKHKNDSIKFWSPSIVNRFYEGCLYKKRLDVPLIIVYDYTDGKLIGLLKMLTSKFRDDGYYAASICTDPISILYGLEYIPVSDEISFNEIKDKIEEVYRVYDFDIIILGLSINKKDANKINNMNISLNPDEIIFLVNSFTYRVKTCIEELNTDNYLIITAEDDIKMYSCFSCKKFAYKDLDLYYRCILKMFT